MFGSKTFWLQNILNTCLISVSQLTNIPHRDKKAMRICGPVQSFILHNLVVSVSDVGCGGGGAALGYYISKHKYLYLHFLSILARASPSQPILVTSRILDQGWTGLHEATLLPHKCYAFIFFSYVI